MFCFPYINHLMAALKKEDAVIITALYRWAAEHRPGLEVEEPGFELSSTGSRRWHDSQATDSDSSCPWGDPAWEAVAAQRGQVT